MVIVSFECLEPVRWYHFSKSPVVLNSVLCQVHLQNEHDCMYMYIPVNMGITVQMQILHFSLANMYIFTENIHNSYGLQEQIVP